MDSIPTSYLYFNRDKEDNPRAQGTWKYFSDKAPPNWGNQFFQLFELGVLVPCTEVEVSSHLLFPCLHRWHPGTGRPWGRPESPETHGLME